MDSILTVQGKIDKVAEQMESITLTDKQRERGIITLAKLGQELNNALKRSRGKLNVQEQKK